MFCHLRILLPVLWGHSLSQIEFSTEYDLVLPLSIFSTLFSLRSPSSCLHFLPHLPVTSILPHTFSSITCFRRQFLCKMWPIQLAFLLFIVCRIFFSSLTLYNTSSFLTWSAHLFFSIILWNLVLEKDVLSYIKWNCTEVGEGMARNSKLQHTVGYGVTCLKIMQMFLVCTVHDAKPWLITLPSLWWRRVLTVVVSVTLLSVDLCSLLLPRDVEAILLLRVLSLLHSPKDEPCSSSRISCTVATLKKSRDGGRIGVPVTSKLYIKEGNEARSRWPQTHEIIRSFINESNEMHLSFCIYYHYTLLLSPTCSGPSWAITSKKTDTGYV